MYGIHIFIQILDEADNAVFLMVFDMFDCFSPPVFKNDRKLRVQIGCLVKPALNLIRFETGLFKNRVVRQKINRRSGFSGFSHHRQQAVFQFNYRNAPLISVMMDHPFPADLDIQISRQGIYHRRPHPMQTAAGLIYGVVKLTARMKRGKYKPLRRHPFFMHTNWNPTSVITDCGRSVLFQVYPYFVTKTSQMLIHRVIHDLIDQMV